MTVMDSADRAERAADLADRRARDADRISRWMIGFGLALAGLLAVQILTLQGDIAALRADVAAILERLP